VDPEGHNDWTVDVRVDLLKSAQQGTPSLQLLNVGEIRR
jgi:hypothetical protein